MAITLAKNPERVMKKIEAYLQQTTVSNTGQVGAADRNRIRRSVWTNAGVPSGAAPTGMSAGDLILDTTNSNVYRYITGTTYVHVTATS